MTCTTDVIRVVTDHEPDADCRVEVRADHDDDGRLRVVIEQGQDIIRMSVGHAVSVAVAFNELLDEIAPCDEAVLRDGGDA